MRFAAFAAAAALAASIATASFAAQAQKPDTSVRDQASNRTFNACVALAKQRGYTSADRTINDPASPVRKFVADCMAGKQS
jgi:hypothetical protein